MAESLESFKTTLQSSREELDEVLDSALSRLADRAVSSFQEAVISNGIETTGELRQSAHQRETGEHRRALLAANYWRSVDEGTNPSVPPPVHPRLRRYANIEGMNPYAFANYLGTHGSQPRNFIEGVLNEVNSVAEEITGAELEAKLAKRFY